MLYFPSSSKSKGGRYFDKFLVLVGAALVVLCLLMTYSAVNARESKPPVTSLKPGDSFPDFSFRDLLQSPQNAIHPEDYADKLLVLSFFGSWCSTCRSSLAEEQEIQNQFKTQLQLVLVSSESREKLKAFFQIARDARGNSYTLPCLAADTLLRKLFVHTLVPHMVWIKAGKVVAITAGDHLTKQNVLSVLDGTGKLPYKKDLDINEPLFLNADLPAGAGYSLFIKGQVDGLGSGGTVRRTGGKLSGRVITNTLLYDMYKSVGLKLIPGFNEKRIRVELKDRSAIMPSPKSTKEWYRQNYCTYDVRVAPGNADSLYYYMLSDLNRNSAYKGIIEKRTTLCLVLKTKTGEESRFATREGRKENSLFYAPVPKLLNYPIELLVARLNEREDVALPVVDETDYSGNVDITFSSNPGSLDDLVEMLQAQGLSLTEETRELEILVIRDDHYSNYP